MTIAECETKYGQHLQPATLVFLLTGNRILLAMKKRGFGEGKWNGVGGKVRFGEGIIEAAVRETQEEVTVTPKNLIQMATIKFYWPHIPVENKLGMQVTVFVAREWDGEPTETEEMLPQWFDINQIPYSGMWPDDPIWLPMILEDKKFQASFIFSDEAKIIDQLIEQAS